MLIKLCSPASINKAQIHLKYYVYLYNEEEVNGMNLSKDWKIKFQKWLNGLFAQAQTWRAGLVAPAITDNSIYIVISHSLFFY